MNVIRRLLMDITDGHYIGASVVAVSQSLSMSVAVHLEMHPFCITQHADFSNMFVRSHCINCVLIFKAIDTTMEVLMFLLMKTGN